MFASRVCVALSLGLLGAAPAPAQTVDDRLTFSAVTGVRSDDVLNLRAGPNARSLRIGKIPHNARGIKTYGCPSYMALDRTRRRRWCQVEYEGVRGWVAGRFLKADGAQ